VAFLCGCDPRAGVICSAHCQWQGCIRGRHTPECIRGERVDETKSKPNEAARSA
jgi:hypothetical protein